MKILLIAFCTLSLSAFHASADDGASSGIVYSPKDNKTPIGSYFTLKEKGKTVYYRYHSQRAKDYEYLEQFLVDGKSVLEIRHLQNRVGFIFSSYKDYMVTTSMTDSTIDKIAISSIKDHIGYTWKRDSEGFYSTYSSRPSSSPRF